MVQRFTKHLTGRDKLIYLYPADEAKGSLFVDIGPGRGDFLFHLAEANPDKTIYGIEIKRKRFEKLLVRREKRGLANTRLVLADAAQALSALFTNESVAAIFINFPDPWPKRKHAKNRLLQRTFLEECAKALKVGGILSIATDVKDYAEAVSKECHKVRGLKPLPKSRENDIYPTYFYEKWKKEEREIHYQKYIKRF